MTIHPRGEIPQKDLVNPTEQADLVDVLFHRINRVIPASQELQIVSHDCKIRDALKLMATKNYSQLPVKSAGKIVGVFSYKGFAQFIGRKNANHWQTLGCDPGDLTVDNCYEKVSFVSLTDEMTSVMDLLDRDGSVLIGTSEHLHGILSGIDLARYLHSIAGSYVLILEIELCLRALIRRQLSAEQIAQAATAVLSSLYEGKLHKIPKTLESMTFDNYRSIIVHPQYWTIFSELFGKNKVIFQAKLIEISELRNQIFHFKRDIQFDQYQELASHRDWFLIRATQVGQEVGDKGNNATRL